MKWYIIRHADKEEGNYYNPRLRHQDQPISAEGQVEAQELCSFFAGKLVSKIFVSEYIRTGQTINYVAQLLKRTPKVDARLNEIDNGLIDGLSGKEIQQQFPDVWNAFVKRDRDFRFPEGESGQDALHRIKSFMVEMQEHGEDIILVTHDGLIRLLLCHILGIEVYRRWDFRVDTCGIMEIEYKPEYERWILYRFNQKCS